MDFKKKIVTFMVRIVIFQEMNKRGLKYKKGEQL